MSRRTRPGEIAYWASIVVQIAYWASIVVIAYWLTRVVVEWVQR